MGFLTVSFAQSLDTWFALQTGFSVSAFVPQAVKAMAVRVVDNNANINTFAITNASLESSTAAFPPVSLTFAANAWTANETVFYAGLEPTEIRISFDIAGVTFGGTVFNFTVPEASPVLIPV